MKRLHGNTPKSRIDWTAENLATLRVMWADPGLSNNEIGRRFGIHAETVARTGLKFGLPLRKTILVAAGIAPPNLPPKAVGECLAGLAGEPIIAAVPVRVGLPVADVAAHGERSHPVLRGAAGLGGPYCDQHRQVAFPPRQRRPVYA